MNYELWINYPIKPSTRETPTRLITSSGLAETTATCMTVEKTSGHRFVSICWLVTVLCVAPALALSAVQIASTPNVAVYPSDFSISRAQSVVLYGTETAWTSSTTFTSSDSLASITGVTVNSATQATMTIQPGPQLGPQTIKASDGSTGTVTVAASLTRSGTSLAVAGAYGTDFVFDPVREFTVDCLAHVLVIADGSGFPAGRYAIKQFFFANLQSQGYHNVIQIVPLPGSPDTPAAAASGTWSYFVGPGGGGYSGGNLIVDDSGAYCFDPDAPPADGLLGAQVTISGGKEFAQGTYAVTDFYGYAGAGSFGQGGRPIFNLPGAGNIGAAGATWAKTGGVTVHTATVNPAFTGAVKLMLLGDGITAGAADVPAALAAQYPNASGITVVNCGFDGATTTMLLPTDSRGRLSTVISAANAAGVTVTSITLGTDETVSNDVPTHKANMQTIVNALFAGIPTLQYVVLEEQPAQSGMGSDVANAVLHQFYLSYASIPNAVQGVSNSNTSFTVLQVDPQLLIDGIHPGATGHRVLTYSWLMSLASSIVAAGGGTPPPAPPSPVITSATMAGGQVGVVFAYQIAATYDPTSFGATGLPSGLSFDSSTGLITGTPVQSGTFYVSLSGVNTTGTGTSSVAITITGGPQVLPPVAILFDAQGSIKLRISSVTGISYQLQGSSDLIQWTDLGNPQPGTGANLDFSSDIPLATLSYFYRVMLTYPPQ